MPCGPIHNMKQVFEDPQVRASRDAGVAAPQRRRASAERGQPDPPVGTPIRYEKPAPLLGEHNDAVLQRAPGPSAERIAELQAKGVV